MLPDDVQTAARAAARTVRVQILMPPSVLTREGQRQLVREVTEIVAKICGDAGSLRKPERFEGRAGFGSKGRKLAERSGGLLLINPRFSSPYRNS
jgi:hypothetical protein